MALKWAITEKFQDYVSAAPFTVYTDNAPLTHVWKSAKLDATGQRWLASLENFDFKVLYKPGNTNTVADALSRQYEDIKDDDSYKRWAKERCIGYPKEKQQDEPTTVAAVKVDDDNTQREINFDWLKLQECDDAIKTVIDTIDNDNKQNFDNKIVVFRISKVI